MVRLAQVSDSWIKRLPQLTVFKLVFASQVTYTFIMATARISLLFLYRRIFNLRLLWFRIAWWCCTAYVSLYCIVQFIGYVAQCRPRPTQNSPTDPNINLCGHRGLQVAVMGYNNAAIDLVILVLPIRMVWTLQMTRRQKVAVGGVFALGLMYAIRIASMSFTSLR